MKKRRINKRAMYVYQIRDKGMVVVVYSEEKGLRREKGDRKGSIEK